MWFELAGVAQFCLIMNKKKQQPRSHIIGTVQPDLKNALLQFG